MDVVFWTSLGFIAYTYAGYPVCVWLLSRLRAETIIDPARVREWPSATVVVAVYNEEQRSIAKIRNLRAQEYESGQLQILFVSDGSTDGTNAALEREGGVRLLSYPERRGKPHALNRALECVESEVVVFTDVRQALQPGAIRFLVARLVQPGIGAVSGELVHLEPKTQAASNIGLYWRYEKWIRKAESRLASTVGVTGALYAIRRRDFHPLPDETLIDDFVVPMQIARRGSRVVFEPRAVIHDELQMDHAGERKRKVRTLTGNFQVIADYPWLLSPWGNRLFFQFISHKVFRLFVPYAMAALLVSSLLAQGALYLSAACAQLAFYAAVLPGFVSPRWRSSRVINFAVVFLDLNWAAVLSLYNFIAGRTSAKWEKT